MASLSEKLRRERELRGISLKQISEDTKIGVRFLEALEQDRLELIPGEFYRRSYLRAYARYLGLDEDRAVNAYAFANQEKPASTEGVEDASAGMSTTGWVALGGCIFLVIGLIYWQLESEPADLPPSEPVTAAPETSSAAGLLSAAGSTMSGEVSEVSVPPLAEDLVRSSQEPLRLKVRVEQSCWLEIRGDGEVLTIGLKPAGFETVLTASQELRLWLGNAGGVSLWMNERPLRPLGSAGQVRKDVVMTLENYTEFVASETGSS